MSGEFSRFESSMKPALTLPDEIAPGGPCVSGERRLFINADGNLYPCERVSETSEIMNIGNIWDGFDFEKVDRILNVAQTTAEDCKIAGHFGIACFVANIVIIVESCPRN